MTAPAGSPASRFLLWGAYVAAFVGLLLALNERSAVSGLRWVMLFSVGIMSVIVFLRRVVLWREGAAGDDGPMQIGLAHLAWGLVALLMVERQSSAAGLIAVALVFALYLGLSAVLRLAVVMRSDDSATRNADLLGVGIVALIAAGITWFAAAALRAAPH